MCVCLIVDQYVTAQSVVFKDDCYLVSTGALCVSATGCVTVVQCVTVHSVLSKDNCYLVLTVSQCVTVTR